MASRLGLAYVDLASTHSDPHRDLLDSGAGAIIVTGGGLPGITVVTRHVAEETVHNDAEAWDVVTCAGERAGQVQEASAMVMAVLTACGVRVNIVDDLDMEDPGRRAEVARTLADPAPAAVLMVGLPTVRLLCGEAGSTLGVLCTGRASLPVTLATDAQAVHHFLSMALTDDR